VKIPGALKAYVEKQLSDIEKISGDIIDSEATVGEEKLGYRVELTLKTKTNSYHIQDKNLILKQAFRSALSTLKTQAKKSKEKLKDEKKRKGKTDIFKRFTFRSEKPEPAEAAGNDTVTLIKNFSSQPLSVEDAIFRLKESGENAYLFLNLETDLVSVVFFNKDSGISLIEAV
jgi:ribosomal subunit interface protein